MLVDIEAGIKLDLLYLVAKVENNFFQHLSINAVYPGTQYYQSQAYIEA